MRHLARALYRTRRQRRKGRARAWRVGRFRLTKSGRGRVGVLVFLAGSSRDVRGARRLLATPGEALLVWSRQVRLRVGVIGLGRLWEARHKPALARLRDRFQVTAVYDQVVRRAEIEAGAARLRRGRGPGRADRAARRRRGLPAHAPVVRPPPDRARLRRRQAGLLRPAAGRRARRSSKRWPRWSSRAGSPFMPEFARRFYPATLRLRELLATTLGPPRLILGQTRLFGFDRYGQPGPTTQIAPAPLLIDPGSYLLDWCRFLFQAEPGRRPGLARGRPARHGRRRGDGPDFESFVARVRRRRDGADRLRPLPPRRLGRGDPVPAPARASRSSPSAGPPGSRCPTGSSGPTPRARTRSGCRWSRPSARSSTTSSIGSSAATSRSPRRSATPWPSPGCVGDLRRSQREGRRIARAPAAELTRMDAP